MAALQGFWLLRIDNQKKMTSISEKIKSQLDRPKKSFKAEIGRWLAKHNPIIAVLDDDPTGCQTIHDIPVFTEWSDQTIDSIFREDIRTFYMLTNSRSMQPEKANDVGFNIGQRLQEASKKYNRKLIVISRSDSTLRGHYPNEVNALANGLGRPDAKQILIPAFFEGGRYTLNDIHYLENHGEWIPAAESPFAKDSSFGFTSTNLKDWIVEKSEGAIKIENIESFSLENLESGGPDYVASVLRQHLFSHYVVNAVSYEDLEAVAMGCLKSDTDILFRTAASFINAIANIPLAPLLHGSDLISSGKGGLVIVGSYVPKTTEQLTILMQETGYEFHQIEVEKIFDSNLRTSVIQDAVTAVDKALKVDRIIVLYTSREVVKGINKSESLDIVNSVSGTLVELVQNLEVRPKFILSKGGITSSDIATRALNVKRAEIKGQILEGVPVWELGPESRFPHMPYIVFPGNVGDNHALENVLNKMQPQ
ncbi:four-carbon acid sugar kinase family protein [Ulvibacterium marinum]|nr:four-carbon acid sugar kinase family protein [Ulvibacterium marinum]